MRSTVQSIDELNYRSIMDRTVDMILIQINSALHSLHNISAGTQEHIVIECRESGVRRGDRCSVQRAPAGRVARRPRDVGDLEDVIVVGV